MVFRCEVRLPQGPRPNCPNFFRIATAPVWLCRNGISEDHVGIHRYTAHNVVEPVPKSSDVGGLPPLLGNLEMLYHWIYHQAIKQRPWEIPSHLAFKWEIHRTKFCVFQQIMFRC